VQIMLLNIVFSLDSIITAIGMVPKEQVMVMVLAVLISTAVMAISVNAVSAFVERHPTVKMLALSFLLLIGMTLLIEGFHFHIPKGYVYFAMGFSVFVEFLNLRATSKNKTKPVHLREPHPPAPRSDTP
jgi:predicted tellurium resistance membrane protein TerC